MAPAYDVPMSDDGSAIDGRDVEEPELLHHVDSTEEIAALEATYRETTIPHGPEVEEFAAALDKCTYARGSAAEKRAQVFKLVDTFYTYTRQRLDGLLQAQSRQRLGRARSWEPGRAGNGSVTGSNDMDLDDADDDNDGTATAEELRKLDEEAQTWDLLRRLLPLRYRDHPLASQAKNSGDAPQSRRQYWNEFVLSESLARERKTILEWLQSSASHGPPVDEVVKELQQNADRGDILQHGWLHTRSKIKLQKRINAYDGVLDPKDPGLAQSHLNSNTLITQLDPDAMTRQGRKLEPQDESFERAIWLGCFELLRRGSSMSEIRDWCAVRTESWRAATISAMPLSVGEDEDWPNFDPNSLVLWRRMAYATARHGGNDDYERAVYGLLSGDISSVQKVAQSWNDVLFLNYNALLRTQFDQFLIRQGGEEAAATAQSLPSFNAVQHHGDPATVGKRLVTSLESNEKTKDEANTVAKAVQGAILSNDLDRHLYFQGVILAKQANRPGEPPSKVTPDYGVAAIEEGPKYFKSDDVDNLRIFAHVLIVVSTLDRLSGFSKDDGSSGPLYIRHRLQEAIITSYVSFLRLSGLQEMIPLYCSKLLQGPKIYQVLSRNLIDITNREARVHQLTIMRTLGLDLVEFVKSQPMIYLADVADAEAECKAATEFRILAPGPPSLKYGRQVTADFFGEDADAVDVEDENIIRAIEWILLLPGEFLEACAFSIRAYKYFLKTVRLNAARALLLRVPLRELVRDKLGIAVRDASEDAGPGWFEDFLSAHIPDDLLQVYDMTREEFVNTVRNLWELECLVKALDSMETLASLAEISRESTTTSRDMWQKAGQEIRLAKACMQPILKNWLLTTNYEEPDFEKLRSAYIPETVMTYISSLHFVGTCLSRDNLLECMDLAARIAEDGSDVAREFAAAHRMKELLEAFASCSKALAIWTAEKQRAGSGAHPSGSKKLREMGWSRELWSIKSDERGA